MLYKGFGDVYRSEEGVKKWVAQVYYDLAESRPFNTGELPIAFGGVSSTVGVIRVQKGSIQVSEHYDLRPETGKAVRLVVSRPDPEEPSRYYVSVSGDLGAD